MSEFVLDDFDATDTAVMEIIPPGGADAIGTITFAGPGHPKTITQSDRVTLQNQKEAADQAQARVNGRKWKADVPDAEQIRTRNATFVVERIVAWSGIKQRGDDGTVTEVPFSDALARTIFLDRRKEWLLHAALEFLTAERSFTSRSAPS